MDTIEAKTHLAALLDRRRNAGAPQAGETQQDERQGHGQRRTALLSRVGNQKLHNIPGNLAIMQDFELQ